MFDAAAMLIFSTAAAVLTGPLWARPGHEIRDAPQDQAFFEWMLAHGARVLADGVNPFYSTAQNYPDGINMMANTSVLAISLPMAPVTMVLGPHLAFNAFLTLALAATGISWYFVLSRHLVPSRVAAFIGALFCAFAPSMVSHAGGHPNIVFQALVPLIVLRTVRLHVGDRVVRNGAVLAGFVVWQAFINLEILFMTAVGLAVFTAVMALMRHDVRRHAIPFLKGLMVTALLSAAALAYPLYLHFFGPQSYRGLPWYIRAMGADLASFVAFPTRSVAGDANVATRLAQNAAEENAFFGWGLVILFAGIVVWMWRRAQVIALAIMALMFAALSLGPQVRIYGTLTNVPSMWSMLQHLPVLNSAVPTRWAMAIAPVLGVLVALTCQRIHDGAVAFPQARSEIRLVAATVGAMAFIPLVPTPLSTRPATGVPDFVTSGTWRRYVDSQHSVVTLPLPDSAYPDPLRWSAMTGLTMRIARGYFLGPGSNAADPADRAAAFSAPQRCTDAIFAAIRAGRPAPPITAQVRAAVRRDLRYWRAGAVVLTSQPRDGDLRRVMTDILGYPPAWIGGLWLWDVCHRIGEAPDDVQGRAMRSPPPSAVKDLRRSTAAAVSRRTPCP